MLSNTLKIIDLYFRTRTGYKQQVDILFKTNHKT